MIHFFLLPDKLSLKKITGFLSATPKHRVMKQFKFTIACILLILSITGCGERDKSKILAQYKFEDTSNVASVSTVKKIEPWVKEGITCWGIIMVINNAGKPVRITEVPVKVDSIQPERIKLEALEDVHLGRTAECDRVSFKKGESWNEVHGDLFKTREEAIHYIDQKYPGLRLKK